MLHAGNVEVISSPARAVRIQTLLISACIVIVVIFPGVSALIRVRILQGTHRWAQHDVRCCLYRCSKSLHRVLSLIQLRAEYCQRHPEVSSVQKCYVAAAFETNIVNKGVCLQPRILIGGIIVKTAHCRW
jgi:hypothetical protein